MAASNSPRRQALAVPENLAVEDHVPVLHEQHLMLSRHSRDRHTLGLIEAALNRLDRDEYGISQECDDEISLKRLFALYWALRCKACQERYEWQEWRAHGRIIGRGVHRRELSINA
jgi:RNA polymerase-binding transcription factor DksA